MTEVVVQLLINCHFEELEKGCLLYTSTEDILEEIYNPVVRRSIRIAVNIMNALIKKYGYPEEVVIEMPRDRNDDEKKKRIKEFQKKQEKESKDIENKLKKEYNITVYPQDYSEHKQLRMKLKLWNEQPVSYTHLDVYKRQDYGSI